MKVFSKLAAAVAILPVLAITSTAYAAGTGQIESGDIYRAKNLTTNGAFADTINAACGDTVQFRVRIHNTGPNTLTNVKVAATLNSASSTSHGSQISLSADNNLDNEVVKASAGVNTSNATTADFVSGSTQLLNNSGSVLKNLPDGILSGGLNIGDIGPLTPDTEVVQFQTKLNCPTPTPVCTDTHATNNGGALPCTYPQPKPTPAPAPKPAALPNTGPGEVAELFVGTSALGAAAHAVTRRFRR